MSVSLSPPLLTRLEQRDASEVPFTINGKAYRARPGDTVLTAVLLSGEVLRRTPFSGAPRTGLCLMGACQDCWVRTVDGGRLRACTTLVEEGLALSCPATEESKA